MYDSFVTQVPISAEKFLNWDKEFIMPRGLAVEEMQRRWEEYTFLEKMGIPVGLIEQKESKFAVSGSLEGKTLIRCFAGSRESISNHLNAHGSISTQSGEKEQNVAYWPNVVGQKFKGRKVDVVHASDILRGDLFAKCVAEYEKEGHIFVKTVHKSHVCGLYDVTESAQRLNGDGEFIISQPLSIRKNNRLIYERNNEEYRCVVVNSEPVSFSQYTDDEQHDIPSQVEAFAFEFAHEYKSVFPTEYVVDIGVLEMGDLAVIELNNWASSGRYIHNTFNLEAPKLFGLNDYEDVWADVRYESQEKRFRFDNPSSDDIDAGVDDFLKRIGL